MAGSGGAPHELSATEASRRIAAGELSSEELVESCLARIRAREAEIRAWQYLDEDLALAQARACAVAPSRGKLHGIPVGIKDIMDTVDMPTGYGCLAYRSHQPAWDAACVAQLRDLGAVIMGKTVTSEFAAYFAGKSRNPHDPARITGISSMGSAAAVADSMVPLATGTQTGGSIIRPASFCGVVGYKPSFGLFNRSGVRPLAESLDTVGWFARTVEDLALVGSLMSGRPGFGQRRHADAPRIGFCRTAAWSNAEPAVQSAIEQARDTLQRAGAVVTEIALPEECAGLNEALLVVLRYEAARAFAHEYRARRSDISETTQQMLAAGWACPPERYDEARDLALRCRARVAGQFASVDVLMTPAAECEAPALGGPPGDSVFNRIWTLLHLPCISLPVLRGGMGLPVGLQIIGPIDRDSDTGSRTPAGSSTVSEPERGPATALAFSQWISGSGVGAFPSSTA